MAAKASGLQQLLIEELQDLYDAERQLVKALPKISKACTDKALASAFRDHLETTRGQVGRLEQIFEGMGMRARSKPCKAMKGLIEEGQELIQEEDEEKLLDAGLVGAGRKVEHYEMAGYESARAVAAQLGMREAAQLLQQTLREEMEADKLLSRLSKQVLKQASAPGEKEEAPATKSRSAARSMPVARARRGSSTGKAEPVTDHERIRQWAESRGGSPACVSGTGGSNDAGMIRIDFPGYSGDDSLQQISWEDWFQKFEENQLALLIRENDNFNKLVRRPEESGQRPKVRTAQ